MYYYNIIIYYYLQVYFTALAISDTVVLVSFTGDRILRSGFGINLNHIMVICHLHKFIRNTSISISSWYVAYIASERALIVLFPLKAKTISTSKNAKRAMIGIAILVILMMSPPLWMADWYSRGRYTSSFLYFQSHVETPFVHVSYAIVPLVLTFIFYFVLLFKIIYIKIRGKDKTKAVQIDKFTKSVLIVFLTYVILTGPSTVVLQMRNLPVWKNTSILNKAIISEIVVFLRNLNYSCNLFIYLATNRQFWLETKVFIRMIPNRIRPAQAVTSSSQATGTTRM